MSLATPAVQERSTGVLPIAIMLLATTIGLGALVLGVPLQAIAVVGAALFALVIAFKPDVATLAVIAIIYSNAAVIGYRFHGLPYAVAAGVPLLLVAPLAYYLLIRRQRLIIAPALPWILGFLLIQLISTLFSRDSNAAAQALGIFLTEGVLLYLLVTNVVRTERMAYACLWLLLVVGAGLGALSVHQQLTQNYRADYLGFAQMSKATFATGVSPATAGVQQPRLGGPLGQQNRYAQIMLVLVPLGMATIWGRRVRHLKLLAGGAMGLIALGAALTFSRGGAVGFVLMVMVAAALRYIRFRQVALVMAAAFGILFLVPQYSARLASLENLPSGTSSADGAVLSRITETLTAVLVFGDHPLIGVGPGLFPAYYTQYADNIGLNVRSQDREAHNLYMGIAAETGIFGLVAFMGAIIVTLRDLARTRSRLLRSRPALAHLAAAYALAIVAYLTTGIFLHLSFERYYWLILALAGAVSVIGLRTMKEEVQAGVPALTSTTPAGVAAPTSTVPVGAVPYLP
ncbi:MAG: O-antigen ligase family protein [Chloroflexota bacterium]|nr:O-antigen ligase family protein [Chloroflexota bacterium]